MSNIVRVRFNGSSKLYEYYNDLRVSVGDFIVVPTPDWPCVVKVEEIVSSSKLAAKKTIQKVKMPM